MRNHLKASQRGFTMIELLFVVLVISIVSAITVPHLTETKAAAREGAAVASLRQIANAQVAFAATSGQFGSLTELSDAGLIDSALASGPKDDYTYQATAQGANDFTVTAVPASSGSGSPRRGFFADASGVIRYTEDGSTPTASSPALVFANSGWAIIENNGN